MKLGFKTRNTFCRTRSLSNATFSFLITRRSPSSKSAAVYKKSLKSDDFALRYGDITIFKMAAVRRVEFWKFSFLITWRSSSSKSAAVYKISWKSDDFHWDMAIYFKVHVNLIHIIWRYSYLNFLFGLKCLFTPQKWFFWGLWTPKCGYLSSRPAKGTPLHKSAFFKLSTVKIRWGVWPVGKLTESVTDTHTHIHRHTHTHTYR